MLVPSGEYIKNILWTSKPPKFSCLIWSLSACSRAIPDNALRVDFSAIAGLLVRVSCSRRWLDRQVMYDHTTSASVWEDSSSMHLYKCLNNTDLAYLAVTEWRTSSHVDTCSRLCPQVVWHWLTVHFQSRPPSHGNALPDVSQQCLSHHSMLRWRHTCFHTLVDTHNV